MPGEEPALHPAPANGNMIFRILGKTGVRLPIVSMGVMNADNPALLKAAWNQGIRHFDTAWIYQNGNNERMIGRFIKDNGIKREEFTLASKVVLGTNQGPAKGKEAKELILSRVEESLSRLQTDHLDILYCHDVRTPEQVNDPYVLEAFEELKEKKKIRFTGFSTHSDWTLLVNDAAEKKHYDVILLSWNYAMSHNREAEAAMKKAYDAGIGLVAMKTQCQQGWYKQGLGAEQQAFYGEKNMHTALLKWVLNNPCITTAVPGFTTFDQLKDDISVAYSLDYSEEEKQFLLNRDVKLALQSVCVQCGSCLETCSSGVDIPRLMRTHMYSRNYGNPLMARITLDQAEKGGGLDKCADCTQCTGTCRNSVPIAHRISELKEVFC